jgi:hypothetical protein
LREWSEDHYRKIAEGYLQTVFSVLAKCGQSIDLITLAKYLSPDALYSLARNANIQSVVEKIEKLEGKEKQIGSLIAEIENMANSEIGHLFDCQGDNQGEVLTLSKALEENAVVYFCLQPLAFPAYASSLDKLIINDLKALASSQLEKSEKKIIYTIFDEFSVFAGDQIRSTQITTLAKEDVIVPNSELISNQITNYMFRDRYWRVVCQVGVAYGSNVALVKEVLLTVAAKHPEVLQREGDKPAVLLRDFGSSSLVFELWCIIRDVNLKYVVASDLNFAIDEAFRQHQITIAFPQRDIHIKEGPIDEKT